MAAEGDAAAHEVLFFLDLWLELWPWLDRDSKAALRGVSVAMRGQVDGSIAVVASPACGFPPDSLSTALLLWPRVTHLTLLAVSDAAELAPLATTALARLTSLTVRQAPRAVADEAHPWDMLATTLSSGVAATLRVVDISACIDLRSIELVRSCAQLRCLWMPGCGSVSDLSPLGACSETFEELWMAGVVQVHSLDPLAACTKLRKLDLSGCLPTLDAQVQDLQLACTQLAAPASVEFEGLVHELQRNIPAYMQENQMAAEGDAAAHEVLFSLDLWLELWRWLDRDSKAALRGVSVAMRGQVDGSIEVVASPACGFSPDSLSTALLLWPRVTHLTLLAVSDAAKLALLATTALARLTSLTVRQAPRAVADEARPWDMLATTLSSGVAATLRVVDLSGCIDLRSMKLVRSCAQLRCLWMPGCVGVSELSPLGACSETLEELWMASVVQVHSLAPLASYTKLCKLDLRACPPALNAQVQDLQLACSQLAEPSSVELEGLAHELQHNIPAYMQEVAANAMASMVIAGAILALVRLLGPQTSAVVQQAAARALENLAETMLRTRPALPLLGPFRLWCGCWGLTRRQAYRRTQHLH
ncbi:hypothetical protein FOA52_013170 [Chlamydomonas sp. UWO 241]|nr:hypothetical protein FOA52_013170 [Chlamydomonas sp. UWO 241]